MAEAATAQRPWWRRIPTALWGVAALTLGLTLGTFYPEQFGFIGTGVKGAFRWLARAAPFIIFFTIAAAVGDMVGKGKAGRLAFWVTLTFTGFGLLGGVVGILGTVPLYGLRTGFEGMTPGEFFRTVGTQLGGLLHTSEALIAVIYAAIVAVLLHYATKWRATEWFARPTRETIRLVGVDGINKVGGFLKTWFPLILFGLGIFIPTAVGDAIERTASSVGGVGGGISTPLGDGPIALYFTALGIQLVLLAAYISIVIGIALWYTRFPVKAFFRDYFFFTYSFAWATSSSAASIPTTLERTRNGLKVRKEITDFVVPLGATMNLDGVMVAAFTITAMAGIIVGYPPTMLQFLLFLIPLKIATMGVPGIPGGIAVVVPPIAVGLFGIPAEVAPTFLAIWFAFSVGLSDQFRTGINTVTNGIVALIFEKAYPRHFEVHAPAPEAPVPSASASAPAAPVEDVDVSGGK
ncbi:MAG TPA: cation:dicarboxylase symporter family transporter [Candidatus Thermoplasmatota archaeon]|nr:cation:dicarboxylase symporter family transporter [Candidatus Thermoplasmatota archaeon]